ncbi:P-loop containing nucleoside triphosphate hydrolase protein [Aspergillus karnatakaensis]|uniref:P-loop containing nucleoside triphosphate hydrolase protein n=1 Tax=Aspergillus karnatakaensis TaxID=1810916 RepID=UPI003CCCB57B
MAQTLQENTALHQLQSEQLELLSTLDNVRAIGVKKSLTLTRLVVFGPRSAGKTTLLQAISGISLPNERTDFVTEIFLRRRQYECISASFNPNLSQAEAIDDVQTPRPTFTKYTSEKDLPLVFEEAREYINARARPATKYTLRIDICGPDKPGLALIDLPGDMVDEEASRAEGGCGKYMADPESIILLVMPAGSSSHMQLQLQKSAAKFDPKQRRTLGVMTQADQLASYSFEKTCARLIRDGRAGLQWHIIGNLPPGPLLDQESDFFSQERWSTVPRDSTGIIALRKRLSKLLLQRMKCSLPAVIKSIGKKKEEKQAQLGRLGSPRTDINKQRKHLFRIAYQAEKIIRESRDGVYKDGFFGNSWNGLTVSDPRRLRALLRELDQEFCTAMLVGGTRRQILDTDDPVDSRKLVRADCGLRDWAPNLLIREDRSVSQDATRTNCYLQNWNPNPVRREDLQSEIQQQVEHNRGALLAGAADDLLVGALFRDQVQPWHELAKLHVLKVWESIDEFLRLLLQYLADEPTSQAIHKGVINPALSQMKEDILQKLRELNVHNSRGPFPYGGKAFDTLRNRLKNRAQIGEQASYDTGINQPSSDRLAASDIIDSMQSFYDAAISNFTTNVAILGIKNCLLLPLETIFTAESVCDMSAKTIMTLASEPVDGDDERETLKQDIAVLESSLRTCNELANSRVLKRKFSAFKQGTSNERVKQSQQDGDQSGSAPASKRARTDASLNKNGFQTFFDPTGKSPWPQADVEDRLPTSFASTSVTTPIFGSPSKINEHGCSDKPTPRVSLSRPEACSSLTSARVHPGPKSSAVTKASSTSRSSLPSKKVSPGA